LMIPHRCSPNQINSKLKTMLVVDLDKSKVESISNPDYRFTPRMGI
jgi:hypothetical protein